MSKTVSAKDKCRADQAQASAAGFLERRKASRRCRVACDGDS